MKKSTYKTFFLGLMSMLFFVSIQAQQDAHNLDQEEIFKVVEEMPRFPGCEMMKAPPAVVNECAQKKMLEFVYENIKYPEAARQDQIEGMVVASFVVDKSGKIRDAKILRDVDGHFSENVLDMIGKMPDWIPGKQRGNPVSVIYTLPVKFKLKDDTDPVKKDEMIGSPSSEKSMKTDKAVKHGKVSPFGKAKENSRQKNKVVDISKARERKTQINPKQMQDPTSEVVPNEDPARPMLNEEKSSVDIPGPPQNADKAETFKIVEEMPRFPGCEDLNDDSKALRKCSQEKMLKYIYSNLDYPEEARKNGVEGMVVIRYTVNEVGGIDDATVMRDIGAGCGEAALKVVNSMNHMNEAWIPGKQRGRTVRVQYTLPVRFRL